MNPPDFPDPSLLRPGRWGRIAVGFGLVLGAGLVWVYVNAERQAETLRDSLEVIRLRGEPVMAADLLGIRENEDPNAELSFRKLQDYPEPGVKVDLSQAAKRGYLSILIKTLYWDWSESEAKSLQAILVEDSASTGEVPRGRNEYGNEYLVETWEEILQVNSGAAREYNWESGAVVGFLASLPLRQEITSDEMVALKVFLETESEVFEMARHGATHGVFDASGAIKRMLASESFECFQTFPYYGFLRGVRCLSGAARLAAVEGRYLECRELLQSAFRLVRVMERQPWSIGYVVFAAGLGTAEDAVASSLAYLPRDVDLSDIESFLEEWDPHSDLSFALRGDLALGNHIFHQVRKSGISADSSPIRSSRLGGIPFLFGSVLDRDQVRYLGLMERIIAECEKPFYDVKETLDELVRLDLDSGWSLVSSLIVPNPSNLHRLALSQVVMGDLALSAFRARRDGIEEASAWLESRIDPFSGKPYRTRVDSDGSLVMWSVGSDGEDGNALPHKELGIVMDIDWRFSPGEADE